MRLLTTLRILIFNCEHFRSAYREAEAYYLPFDGPEKAKQAATLLKNVLEDKNILKVGFNIKATMLALEKVRSRNCGHAL